MEISGTRHIRIARTDFYHQVAALAAQRGTCPRAQVGAIIVQDKRIVATGYNGAPPGHPHCDEIGCEGEDGCERAVHAEANAIVWAARAGVAVEGGEMYCTHAMCLVCAKLVIAAGIRKVSYRIPYRDARGVRLLKRSNILLEYYPEHT